MADSDRQYRPLAQNETGIDDPLSVRALREMAWSINNYQKHVMGPKVLSLVSPGGTMTSEDDTSTERLVHPAARRWVPEGFTKIHWTLQGKLSNASATSCAVKLYCCDGPYRGSVAFDTAKIDGAYSVDTLTLTSTTHQIKESTSLSLTRSAEGFIWLLVTGTNGTAGAGYWGELLEIAATVKGS